MVIGDMLGVPREDAEKLVDWTNRTTAFEDPRVVPDMADTWTALKEVFGYVDGIVERAARSTRRTTSRPRSSRPRSTASGSRTRRS